jgi:hypothetical protein
MSNIIELTGLDGSNPLAFLAAIGTLRLADQAYPRQCRMKWIAKDKWLPVLEAPFSQEQLVAILLPMLNRCGDDSAMESALKAQKTYEKHRKQARNAEAEVKKRRLPREERDTAIEAEVKPLYQKAEASRTVWLGLLETAVPVPFLSLGKSLAVTESEFGQFTHRVGERLHTPVKETSLPACRRREDADFAVAFGCEAYVLKSGRIVPTEFQLINGSGQQFFLETFRILMEEITSDKLQRALFGPWTYPDPKRSFRWNPLEDRRYALGWADPSDEQVSTEHGANLLAAMALPLFPAIPTSRGMATTGFADRARETFWTWPIWDAYLSIDLVRSIIALEQLRVESPPREYLRRMGIPEVYRVRKIEVGKAPNSKLNFTQAESV